MSTEERKVEKVEMEAVRTEGEAVGRCDKGVCEGGQREAGGGRGRDVRRSLWSGGR